MPCCHAIFHSDAIVKGGIVAKTNWLIEQIEFGLSEIRSRDSKAENRSVSIARPNRTQGAYLKINWIPSSNRIGYPAGDVEVITYERPQAYGAELFPAGDSTDLEKDVVGAATHYRSEEVFLYTKWSLSGRHLFRIN